ncbi:MAG: cobyric acid synthase [Nitrospiraceae bacterium]|nr:cobyric acid synthase [Nitrospiraceae bacterium]
MAKTLMIQGTGSGAGKSLIAAAFCRIFRDMGLKVAPFKSQNMALNSHITFDGGEIGRAQALQAEAAGIEPSVDMNPVLLKASGDMGSQVILQGRVHATMKAREYYAFRKEAWEVVKKSYARLVGNYDVIVIEGAGSPAEINLMDVDIVNMAMARHAKAPVLLVGDIDKGGVFASLYGTAKLLGRDSRFIKAFLINKFRGDVEILGPGLEMIRDKTGIPVIGVLPYIHDLGLPEEDGMALYQNARFRRQSGSGAVRIVVVRLKYISNFTDFDPFYHEPDVEILYSTNASDIENADLVILPGTKNTVQDLMLLKEQALDTSVRNAFKKNVMIMGMCGGYQMLGRRIFDPEGIESPHPEVDGIGLLDIETTFGKEKRTRRVEAELMRPPSGREADYTLKGYEIHMGQSTGDIGMFRVKSAAGAPNSGNETPLLDGAINRNCWGTYLHGIFDNDLFRREIINTLRRRKGLAPLEPCSFYAELVGEAIDRLADVVRDNVDMAFIRETMHL